MKWIGQHIWSFISRFRNDVYLESVAESAQDHVVGIDADGKLYKQDVAAGDITGVTAGDALIGGGTSGTVTINHEDTSSQHSVNNSGETWVQDITLDTYGHVIGITSAASGNRYYKTVTAVLDISDIYGLNFSSYELVPDSSVGTGEVLLVHDIITKVTVPNWGGGTGVRNDVIVNLQFGGSGNAGGYNKTKSMQALATRWAWRQDSNTTKMYRPWVLDNGIFGSNTGLIEDGLGLRMWTNLDPSGSASAGSESITEVKVYCIYSILTI